MVDKSLKKQHTVIKSTVEFEELLVKIASQNGELLRGDIYWLRSATDEEIALKEESDLVTKHLEELLKEYPDAART